MEGNRLLNTRGSEGGSVGTAVGSGVEVDSDGTVIAALGVVSGAEKLAVGLDNGKAVVAHIVARLPAVGLAVLHISPQNLTLHPLRLGDSGKVGVGDEVAALGEPFGLGVTLTTGIISAVRRQITTLSGSIINQALQTDAPMALGDLGGPLVNLFGEVIGINTELEAGNRNRGGVGIAFATPIDAVKGELRRLKAT